MSVLNVHDRCCVKFITGMCHIYEVLRHLNQYYYIISYSFKTLFKMYYIVGFIFVDSDVGQIMTLRLVLLAITN